MKHKIINAGFCTADAQLVGIEAWITWMTSEKNSADRRKWLLSRLCWCNLKSCKNNVIDQSYASARWYSNSPGWLSLLKPRRTACVDARITLSTRAVHVDTLTALGDNHGRRPVETPVLSRAKITWRLLGSTCGMQDCVLWYSTRKDRCMNHQNGQRKNSVDTLIALSDYWTACVDARIT